MELYTFTNIHLMGLYCCDHKKNLNNFRQKSSFKQNLQKLWRETLIKTGKLCQQSLKIKQESTYPQFILLLIWCHSDYYLSKPGGGNNTKTCLICIECLTEMFYTNMKSSQHFYYLSSPQNIYMFNILFNKTH